MDEEELRKRNTDCVYFLASPLTCKKGLECEYRHSEVARLNPRDCWYWLEGSCLNPSCAFRHPPLESRTGAETESADPHYGLTQPVNKMNVPCFFFFKKYFCKNGDRCPFLHGTDVSTHDWKSSKASSGANDVVASEKKITTGSNTESTPVETRPNISETTPAGATDTQHKPKRKIQQADLNKVASDGEEEPTVRLDSLIPAEGFIQSRSRTATDQSSEGHLDGLVEREEWLESSPGFDVLVGEKSENLVYEDDGDYLSALGEGGEHNLEFMRCGYNEEDIKYDPEYPEPGVEYEQQIHDSHGGLDTVSGDSREGIFCRILSRKRKSLPKEPAFSGRRGVDLRDLLKKRRMIDGHGESNFLRRNESSRLIVERREMPQWHVNNEYESMQNGVNHNQRSRFRRGHINRQHFQEKRRTKQHLVSSEVWRKSAQTPRPRERRCSEQSSMFTGPKTLDQIKEEKKKAQESEDIHPIPSGAASESFQGPKHLGEILKDKRRLGSVVGRCNDSS